MCVCEHRNVYEARPHTEASFSELLDSGLVLLDPTFLLEPEY